MPDELKISVVIPTYNRERIVTRAVESVLGQSLAPAEVLVVDDGSTDGTKEALQQFGSAIRYIGQPNKGVSAARNLGVREAKNAWIAFLDSDDTWVPEHLARMRNAIRATSGKAPLYFADVQLAPGKRLWEMAGIEVQSEWRLVEDAGDWVLLNVQPMLLQASVISKDAYWRVGGLPEGMRTREDTLLFLKLGLSYPACAVAGCGTIMNSQDEIRLTKVFDDQTAVYSEASVALYRDLLGRLKNLSKERRQLLTESLVGAHFGAARVLVRKKKYVAGVRHLVSAFAVHPVMSGKELSKSLGRKSAVVLKLAPATLRPDENKDGGTL